MPNKARNHIDMLQICCGICGPKKKRGLLRKITEHILKQIKCIDGYKDYNLSDDRNIIKLSTSGLEATVQINPSTSKINRHIKTETLDQIRTLGARF